MIRESLDEGYCDVSGMQKDVRKIGMKIMTDGECHVLIDVHSRRG